MKKRWMSLFVAAMGLLGCDGNPVICTREARPSLQVMVVDAVSGQSLCDAAVAVTTLDGSFSEALMAPQPTLGGEDCNYFGPYERPGRFLVMASREGYQMGQQSDVFVTQDECHVQTVPVVLRLQPSPQMQEPPGPETGGAP